MTYRTGTVHYTREVIASHPADVIAVRLAADRPGMLQFHARLSSALRHSVAPAGRVLMLRGEAPSHVDPSYYDADEPVLYGRVPAHGVPRRGPGEPRRDRALAGRHALRGPPGRRRHRRRAVSRPPTVSTCGVHPRPRCCVATATSFNGYDKSPSTEGRDPGPIAAASLASSRERSPGPISATRTWPITARCSIAWRSISARRCAGSRRTAVPASQTAADDLTTDQRIVALGAKDPRLVELLFQYGRYLLIACSRPGTQPANLQGIWNEEVRAPWSSNYTININTQMNYWPAETTSLAELHEPLLTLVEELAVNGRKTAIDQLRRARLGGAPQHRPLAALGDGRRLGQRRPGVGALADGRPVAGAAPVRALPVRRRPRATCATARIR